MLLPGSITNGAPGGASIVISGVETLSATPLIVSGALPTFCTERIRVDAVDMIATVPEFTAGGNGLMSGPREVAVSATRPVVSLIEVFGSSQALVTTSMLPLSSPGVVPTYVTVTVSSSVGSSDVGSGMAPFAENSGVVLRSGPTLKTVSGTFPMLRTMKVRSTGV